MTKTETRARRPPAAHYPSATMPRNPSADECPLAEPLIRTEAARHARSRGSDITDGTYRHLRAGGQTCGKSRVSVRFLFPAFKRLRFRAALIPPGSFFFFPGWRNRGLTKSFNTSKEGISEPCQCYVVYLWIFPPERFIRGRLMS